MSVIIITFSDSGVKVEIERVDRRMMSADDDCRLGRAGPCKAAPADGAQCSAIPMAKKYNACDCVRVHVFLSGQHLCCAPSEKGNGSRYIYKVTSLNTMMMII